MADTFDVIMAAYPSVGLSRQDFDGLVQLVKDKRVRTEGVILVEHDEDDEVRVTETGDHLGRKGLGWGNGRVCGGASPAAGFGDLGRAERHLRSDPGSAQVASARTRGCKASGAGHRAPRHPSPNPGATADPRCPELVPRRDKHGDPTYQRCRPSVTPPRTAIHGLAALMLTTCCLRGTAPSLR